MATLALTLSAACDDGTGPDPPPNQPPVAVGAIPDLILLAGDAANIDVAANFSDPEQATLLYRAATSNATVVSVSSTGSVLTLTGISAGTATIVVTATDPAGFAVQQVFQVAVPATPVVELASDVPLAPEGDRVVVDLVISAPPPVPITVSFTLGVDLDEGTPDADTADFVDGMSGTVDIEAGDAEASIEILVRDDEDIEPPREVFTVTLDDPPSSARYELGHRRTVTAGIAEGVCDRTPQVARGIMNEVGVENCSEVDDQHLGAVWTLVIGSVGPASSWSSDLAVPKIGPCDIDAPFSTDGAHSWFRPETPAQCVLDGSGKGDGRHSNGPNAAPDSAVIRFKSSDFAGLRNLNQLAVLRSSLADFPPELFAGLENLGLLALFENRIATLPPGIFSGLSNLTELIISGNGLRELPDDAFSDLSSLLVLYLDRNQLSRLPTEVPGGLEQLVLSSNQMTELPVGWFERTRNLQVLTLDNNAFTEVPSGAFSDLSELTELHLWGNELRDLADGAFSGLVKLERLFVAENELTKVSSGLFSGLSNLEWLALDKNRIEEVSGDAFAELTDLERLWLSGNQLETVPPGVLSGLTELEFLALAVNEISELAPDVFVGLPSLVTLYLSENRLSDLPPSLFADLPALEGLYLNGNRLEQLPEELFAGLSGLEAVALEDNPGAPFQLMAKVERVDDPDLLAPGPGTVTVSVALGAPFAMRVPLAAYGGELADGETVVKAGEKTGTEVVLTPDEGRQEGVQVSAGPPPPNPAGFTGFAVTVGDPLVLFGDLSNRAPYALRAIPWQRLRAGGDGLTFMGSSYFRDPDGDELEYSVAIEDTAVVSATVVEDRITVTPLSGGASDITLWAHDPAGVGLSISFSILVRDSIPGSYDIDLVFTDSVALEHREVFSEAIEWWMTILADMELPNMPTDQLGQLGCGGVVSDVSVPEIDELLVVAALREIDGPRGILAGAQPCAVREESMLPFLGVMLVDVDDLNTMDYEDQRDLILHEMGHVLGIGSLWSDFGLLRNPSLETSDEVDTHFAGPLAIAAFDNAGGTSYADGDKVPVENRAGPGSGDVHWRQSVLQTELMTPYASIGARDPLSAITIQSLADLGYVVDIRLAEPYTLPGTAAPDIGELELIYLGDDVLDAPIIVLDLNGRVTRVIGG